MHHSRRTRKLYQQRIKSDGCPFCDQKTLDNSVRKTKFSYIVPNITHYDFWEMRDVSDHLLIAPLRHVHSLAELRDEERLDIMNLIAEYEVKGYNIYARSVDSVTRSVAHQHTHLIKVSNKRSRFVLFLQKPYLLIKK